MRLSPSTIAWTKPLAPISPGRARHVRGALLGEMLLGLLAAALLGLLLFTALQRVRQEAKIRDFEKQLQEFSSVITEYRARHGAWPDTASDLGASLLDLGWSRGSPFGGEYGLKPAAGAGQSATIVVTAFHPGYPLSLSTADLVKIDQQIDDGDLMGGRFRTGYNGWPVYQLAKSP